MDGVAKPWFTVRNREMLHFCLALLSGSHGEFRPDVGSQKFRCPISSHKIVVCSVFYNNTVGFAIMSPRRMMRKN